MRYLTRNNVNPNQKPNIFIVSDKYEEDFEIISRKIRQICDCSIWFPDNEFSLNDSSTEDMIKQSRLVIFLLNKGYLLREGPMLSKTLDLVKSNLIPILPILLENGIEKQYNIVFGNIQFLSQQITDNTVLSFDEKLKRYINSVIEPEELLRKIIHAFDKFVFISYRKRDRSDAQRLIHLIHDNDICRDIGIWYDEFLTPGETFPEEIQKAIIDSGLFIMAVTSKMTDIPNYVLNEEYPFAKKHNKRVIPVEISKTDKERFYSLFGLDLYSIEESLNILVKWIDPNSSKLINNEKEHLFFIGLAYLNGIYVESDTKKGISLIQQAANQGLFEAIEKLTIMYSVGQGVIIDYKTAFKWAKKGLELAKKDYCSASPEKGAFYRYISCLKRLGSLARKNGDKKLSNDYYLLASDTIQNEIRCSNDLILSKLFNLIQLYELGIIEYELAYNLENIDIDKSIETYLIAIDYFKNSRWNNPYENIAICHLHIGVLYKKKKAYISAATYTKYAYDYFFTLDDKTYSASYYHGLAAYNLAEIEYQQEIDTAVIHAKEAVKIFELLYLETNNKSILYPWFDATFFLAKIMLNNGNEDNAYNTLLQLIDITCEMDTHFDYENEHDTENEIRLCECLSIACYYAAIVAGIRNDNETVFHFLTESQFALWRLQRLCPGEYDDCLQEVETLLEKVEQELNNYP